MIGLGSDKNAVFDFYPFLWLFRDVLRWKVFSALWLQLITKFEMSFLRNLPVQFSILHCTPVLGMMCWILFWKVPKQWTNRMLLEPRCTGLITHRRHPLCLGRFLIRLSSKQDQALPSPIIALPCQSVSKSLLLLRFDWLSCFTLQNLSQLLKIFGFCVLNKQYGWLIEFLQQI